MKVKDVISKLGYQAYSNEIADNKEVNGVFIGDLLSYVMGNGKEEACWVTIQAHLNVIAVAVLREFPMIIISNTPLEEEFISKAMEENIALVSTKDDIYLIAKKLIDLGL